MDWGLAGWHAGCQPVVRRADAVIGEQYLRTVLLFPGATGAGRHEARVCIVCIINSSFVLPVSLRWLVPLLLLHTHYSFSVSALLQAYNYTSATLHTASRHISLGEVSISWAAPFICGIQPSIAFLPCLCHHSAFARFAPPRPLEPQESKPSSVCCLTPYALLLPYRHRVVSRPSNAHGQIYHARNNHAISACSRFCIAPLCLIAHSLSAGHICIALAYCALSSSSLAATDYCPYRSSTACLPVPARAHNLTSYAKPAGLCVRERGSHRSASRHHCVCVRD
jgi:hypothetical protein